VSTIPPLRHVRSICQRQKSFKCFSSPSPRRETSKHEKRKHL